MPNIVDQKIRLLTLYELLYSKTDAGHALSTQEIIEVLSGKGIDVTRKTIYDDIALLNQYGYEVLCERGRSNRYYVVNMQFERSEIQMLLSAIDATQVLSNSKSFSLMQKLL